MRVLVRGLPLPEGARHELAGQMVLSMGRSKPSRWDGVVWTSAPDAAAAIKALEAHAKVVAVRRADDEPPPPPPSP